MGANGLGNPVVERGHHVAAHFQQKHGQRKRRGKDQRLFERLTLCGLALGRGVFHGRTFTGLGHGRGFIASLGNGGNQRAHIGAVIDRDAGTLGRQIDHGVLHAGHFFQRPLHPAHARGAGHAAYLQVHTLCWHGIAGFFNGRHGLRQDGRSLGGVVQFETGFFGGQIHHSVLHAGDLFERALYPAHTGCAGHALDRKVKSAWLRQCIHCVLHSRWMQL